MARQLRAKNHTACHSDRRCRTDFNSRICGDLFLHLHSAADNILLPICLVRVQSNRYHQSHYCAKHESGGYSDLGDTKRCVCISCLSVAQMRLLKPCTDLAMSHKTVTLGRHCTCHISTVRLQTAVVLTQFSASSFH